MIRKQESTQSSQELKRLDLYSCKIMYAGICQGSCLVGHAASSLLLRKEWSAQHFSVFQWSFQALWLQFLDSSTRKDTKRQLGHHTGHGRLHSRALHSSQQNPQWTSQILSYTALVWAFLNGDGFFRSKLNIIYPFLIARFFLLTQEEMKHTYNYFSVTLKE